MSHVEPAPLQALSSISADQRAVAWQPVPQPPRHLLGYPFQQQPGGSAIRARQQCRVRHSSFHKELKDVQQGAPCGRQKHGTPHHQVSCSPSDSFLYLHVFEIDICLKINVFIDTEIHVKFMLSFFITLFVLALVSVLPPFFFFFFFSHCEATGRVESPGVQLQDLNQSPNCLFPSPFFFSPEEQYCQCHKAPVESIAAARVGNGNWVPFPLFWVPTRLLPSCQALQFVTISPLHGSHSIAAQ